MRVTLHSSRAYTNAPVLIRLTLSSAATDNEWTWVNTLIVLAGLVKGTFLVSAALEFKALKMGIAAKVLRTSANWDVVQGLAYCVFATRV